ncbi:SagB/ThcOx family dehydrogenase [Staphylococcus ratti]|uniref:SagB/ThcOx family dehydrogenase n=1 Tax=Staphylococcus ratti TaxID=2892440 RepID=A0ABY3PB42_9STAP|nr:SagB/ThcOx family dehydrogenase [Staphylococcus ratti]UEX89528.1 SagB/ThcOx family dehydrogenase [Staphylococcus ratti]
MKYKQFYWESSLNDKNYNEFNERIKVYYEKYRSNKEKKSYTELKNKSALNNLFIKRKTSRDFKVAIAKDELNNLLDATFNISYPSAGALYGLEIYCFVINVKGLTQGVYKMEKEGELTIFAETNDMKELINTLTLNYYLIDCSSCYFIIVAHTETYIQKYGERGFRFALQESGHLAQNIVLKATELSLRTFISGGYIEERYAEVLDLSKDEFVIYEIAIGK